MGIAVTALQQFMGNAFIEETRKTIELYDAFFYPEEMANWVVHPVTKETITKYKQLIATPLSREVWEKAIYKECGCLTRGYEESISTYHIQGDKHNETPPF